jgi:hypothetical protein
MSPCLVYQTDILVYQTDISHLVSAQKRCKSAEDGFHWTDFNLLEPCREMKGVREGEGGEEGCGVWGCRDLFKPCK